MCAIGQRSALLDDISLQEKLRPLLRLNWLHSIEWQVCVFSRSGQVGLNAATCIITCLIRHTALIYRSMWDKWNTTVFDMGVVCACSQLCITSRLILVVRESTQIGNNCDSCHNPNSGQLWLIQVISEPINVFCNKSSFGCHALLPRIDVAGKIIKCACWQ